MVPRLGKGTTTDFGTNDSGTDNSGTGHVTPRLARLNAALPESDLENEIGASTDTDNHGGDSLEVY